MNCKDVQAHLSAYLDGKTLQPASSQLKQHLANCVRCGDALQKELEMRAILRELSELPLPNPPADFADRAFKAAFSQQRVARPQTASGNELEGGTQAISQSAQVQPETRYRETATVVDIALAGKRKLPATESKQHHLRRQGFFWGFSSAAAVALMMWGVSAMILTSPESNRPRAQLAKLNVDEMAKVASQQAQSASANTSGLEAPVLKVPVLKVALHQTKHVKLAFKAQRAMANAKISISLPVNISLEGYPGKRTIEWETQLAAGDNVLSLPILADQPIKSGETDYLVAKVSHQGGENTLSVRLQVVDPGMSHNEYRSRNSA